MIKTTPFEMVLIIRDILMRQLIIMKKRISTTLGMFACTCYCNCQGSCVCNCESAPYIYATNSGTTGDSRIAGLRNVN